MMLPRPTLRSVGLAGLIGMTSLAVGATSSYYLVPVYLLVMAWLLSARPATAEVHARPVVDSVPDRLAEPQAEVQPVEALAGSDEPSLDPEEAPPQKRSRSRTRKPRSKPKSKAEVVPLVPRAPATWVQVSPGKFVRVELGESPTMPEEPVTSSLEPTGALDPHQDGQPALETTSVHDEPGPPDSVEREANLVFETVESAVISVDTAIGTSVPGPDHDRESRFLPEILSRYEVQVQTPSDSIVATAISFHDDVTRTAAIPSSEIMAQLDTQASCVEPIEEIVIEAGKPVAPGPATPETMRQVCDDSSRADGLMVPSCRTSHARYVAAGVLRSSRSRPEGRPSSRRSGGRVGIPPRVKLSRE